MKVYTTVKIAPSVFAVIISVAKKTHSRMKIIKHHMKRKRLNSMTIFVTVKITSAGVNMK